MPNSLNPQLDFFGLDISHRSVKLAKMKKSKKGIELSDFGKLSLESGLVEKGKVKDQEGLSLKIKNLLRNKKSLNTNYAAISLPEEKSFFQIMEVPKVKKSRLKKMIEYEAEDCIPLSIEEVYLDYQIISEEENSIKVLITAIPRKIVNPHVSAVKKAGLFPVLAEVESMSIVRALVKNGEKANPLLLIDIGETKTILIVLSGNVIIFTSYILISSGDFTGKIAKENGVSLSKAEEIKIKNGISRPDIADCLNPLLEEAIREINKHLDYYNSYGFSTQSTEKSKDIEKIILCGGGANLKGLPDYLSHKLNLSVEKGNPFVNLRNPERNFSGNKLSYGVAFGLALRNFDQDFNYND